MNHEQRRAKGRTTNSGISLTDQSAAHDTNINVILKKYGVTGVAYGTTNAPEWLDHTQLPQDLREAFDMARRAAELKRNLPEQLRERSIEQLLALTPEEVTTILKPPEPPAKPPAPPAPGDTK